MNDISGAVRPPLHRPARSLLVIWGLLLLGGFALARTLDPDPRGFGTHQRLGLPPCTFRQLSNLPCPGCGMTTSFAHFTRGNLIQSVRSNVGGAMLAAFCAALVPWCLVSAFCGRPAVVASPAKTLSIVLSVIAVVTLTQWLFRVFPIS
jgi:hypothetical protein